MQTNIKGQESWASKLSRILNSTVCFVIAYMVFTIGYWTVTAWMGNFFKMDAFVYYYGVKFMLQDQEWYLKNIVLIFSSGPLFCLFFGLLCLYGYNKLKTVAQPISLVLLWGFVIGTSMFSAQSLIASLGADQYNSPFYNGLAVTFAWLYIPMVLIYLLNIPFALLLAFFAVNTGPQFLRMSYSYTKVNKLSRRRRYFFETAIVPFIIGAVVTSAITFPQGIFLHAAYLLSIAIFLFITWYSMAYIEIMKDDIIKNKWLQSLNPFMIFALAIIIALVITTREGVYFSYN
jgi:hypothetical protein